ncbi:MAG: hypothetical protein ACAI25_21075 [Planctomycetota bacterium]
MGYHGCERATARRVLLGEEELTPSSNDYDWLGHGIYFWEHGLARAHQFAEEKRERGELADPVVIGAYLQLGRCLDLTDVWATRLLGHYFEELRLALAEERKRLPVNGTSNDVTGDRLLRRLDCAVINWCLRSSDAEARALGRPHGFDTVRGVFEEGPPAFPGAAIRQKSHVQVSVRNPACILGLFRPVGYTL